MAITNKKLVFRHQNFKGMFGWHSWMKIWFSDTKTFSGCLDGNYKKKSGYFKGVFGRHSQTKIRFLKCINAMKTGFSSDSVLIKHGFIECNENLSRLIGFFRNLVFYISRNPTWFSELMKNLVLQNHGFVRKTIFEMRCRRWYTEIYRDLQIVSWSLATDEQEKGSGYRRRWS